MSAVGEFFAQFLRRTKSGFLDLLGQRQLAGAKKEPEEFVPELDYRQLELQDQAEEEMEMHSYTLSSSEDEVEHYTYNQDNNSHTTGVVELPEKKVVRLPVGYYCK